MLSRMQISVPLTRPLYAALKDINAQKQARILVFLAEARADCRVHTAGEKNSPAPDEATCLRTR